MKYMEFLFSVDAPQQQFVSIELKINVHSPSLELMLPTWRPGRYQVADFAKNIKGFKVFDNTGKPCQFKKTNKSTWEIETDKASEVIVHYKYYAAEMNAGSTFLDESQLYVNPVNCCMYVPELTDQPHSIRFEVPKEWEYAGPLELKNNTITAQNFDTLADSPFFYANQLQHKSYSVKGTTFHIWFNGLVKPEWEKLIPDFKAFTKTQLDKFLEFPTDEYHFMFQILPYATYHGVEHEKCTIITLGPSYAVFDRLYKELLGVSSHELYHTWNVKAIRPIEMFPYDFSKENFTNLGYIAEGVTTYQGDLMLFKSGVFDVAQYFQEMNAQLQKHFDNFGRFNYSVAESSWDTWLDGYEAGVPGRKVSIYTEGCLLAFILDVLILKETINKKSLDDVMRALYFKYAQENKGVSEADFKKEIKNIAGTSFEWLFTDYYHGTKAYETLLVECFEYLGIALNQAPSNDLVAAHLGLKTKNNNGKTEVYAIYPGSNSDLAGVMLNDKIIAINNVTINNDLAAWLQFFEDETWQLTIERNNKLIQLVLPNMGRAYYQKYWLSLIENPDKNQRFAFEWWSK